MLRRGVGEALRRCCWSLPLQGASAAARAAVGVSPPAFAVTFRSVARLPTPPAAPFRPPRVFSEVAPVRPPRVWSEASTRALFSTQPQPGAPAVRSLFGRLRGGSATVSTALATLPAQRAAAAASVAARASAWWAAHRFKVFFGVGLTAALVLWRSTFWVARRFMSMTEWFAELGFLAMAIAATGGAAAFFVWRRMIWPTALFRTVMGELKGSHAVKAALGTNLVASETRAFVLTGGGLTLKRWRPHFRSRRCHFLVPVTGSSGQGVVSAIAKRSHGKYVFKLLAVDTARASGGGGGGGGASLSGRVYIHGDDVCYNKDTILKVLREPLVAQLDAAPAQIAANEAAVEAEEEAEEAEEAAAEAAEAARQVADEGQAAASVAGDEGGASAGEATRAAQHEDLYAWDHFVLWLHARQQKKAEGVK